MIIRNIIIISITIISIIGTPSSPSSSSPPSSSSTSSSGHRRDTGGTPRAFAPRTGNIWSGRASATRDTSGTPAGHRGALAAGGDAFGPAAPQPQETFSRPPTQLRLARTHGTHEHETEIDFPVGGLSVPLRSHPLTSCLLYTSPSPRDREDIGGEGVRSKWNGEPPTGKSVSVSCSCVPCMRARRSCVGGREKVSCG